MADVEAIIQRGSEMGLRSPRTQAVVGRHGKVWKTIRADQLKEGDIVKGLGQVHMHRLSPATGAIRARIGVNPVPHLYEPSEPVEAFVEKDR